MPIPETKISSLESWLLDPQTKCFVSPKIEIRDTEYGGRGLIAKEPIGSHVPIIKISHSYLLNFTTIVAHILSFNHECELPVAYKGIVVPKTGSKDDDHNDDDEIVTKFYSKVGIEELLALSSFQIVSMYLVLEKLRGAKSFWSPFIDVLPTIDDFASSPFIWKVLQQDLYDKLSSSLPDSTRSHTDSMHSKFTQDYRKVLTILESYQIGNLLPINQFLTAWICVNSRCLYMEIPESKNSEGNFTMAPYVDFINHSSMDQCVLKIERSGFYVKSPSGIKYQENDELFLSYGPHSNEFLLCEYGFMLDVNPWNDIDITKEVLKLLTKDQIEFLREKDYYGDYTVSEDSISFRTEIALAVAQETSDLYFNRRLDAYLNGITDGSFYKGISNRLLKRILLQLKHEAQEFSDWTGKEKDIEKSIIGRLYKDRLRIIDKRLESLD